MEPTILCGKQFAEHADISGSRFQDVNLTGAEFDNLNLQNAVFHDVNLSDIRVSAVQIGGATFPQIGPPPDPVGNPARHRPVVFEDSTLCDSTFRKVDMSNAKLVDCNIEGTTVDGIRISELLEEYKRKNGT